MRNRLASQLGLFGWWLENASEASDFGCLGPSRPLLRDVVFYHPIWWWRWLLDCFSVWWAVTKPPLILFIVGSENGFDYERFAKQR